MIRWSRASIMTAAGTVLACILGLEGIGTGASGQFVFAALSGDGRKAGDLILGQTTVAQATKMFPGAPRGYQGNPRPPRGYPPVKVGQVAPRPTFVYNPWMTMYALFFDENLKLVIILDGGRSRLRGTKREELLTQYPQLRETGREAQEYEMQGEIQACVTLMVLLDIADNTVGDIAYAFTCPTTTP